MTNQEDINQIEKARRDLIISYGKALDTYLLAIKNGFNRAIISDKEKILKILESVALGREILNPIEPFNGKRARKIRENSELSQNGLAIKLVISESQLSKYENGERCPSYPMSETSEKYLRWLASQGYNPYNIDFSR